MKYFSIIIMFTFTLTSCSKRQDVKVIYPHIFQNKVVDTVFDSAIIDEYRNLEDLNDSMVSSWFKSQNDLTKRMLGRIKPDNALFEEVLRVENEAKKGEIIERYIYNDDQSYIILKHPQGDNVSFLYYKKSKYSKEELLINPNDIKEGYRITFFNLSPDFSKIAFSLSKGGKDQSELFIYDMETRKLLPEVIKNVAPRLVGGVNWLPDNSGFFYLQLPHFDYKDPTYLENSKSILYKIGENPNVIKEVFSIKKTPEINLTSADFPIVQTRKDNPNLLLGRVSGNSPYKDVYYSKIKEQKSLDTPDWKVLFKQSDQIDQYVIIDNYIYYRTSKDASNFKICKSLIGSDYSKGEVLIYEKENEVIVDFIVIDEAVYFSSIKNGVKGSFYCLKDGAQNKIELPFASGSCYIRKVSKDVMITIGGWINPSANYRYQPFLDEFEFVDLKIAHYPDFKDLVVEEIEVVSHDGQLVPLSIIKNSYNIKDGSNRVLMMAYGAYGSSLNPFLETSLLNWVKNGNILAVAHVRGGGEKGDAWHKGGFKMTKPNSWKDFIACTEYLIDNKYSSSEKMIGYGVSAGGITISRALTERPDLYRVGLMYAPFINATRSEFMPNGANSTKEFGTLKNEEEAKGLIEMDAYLHINKQQKYPAIYTVTGFNDGLVAAWDSGKFVAKMQNISDTKNPVLMRVNFEDGHGSANINDSYQTVTDMYAFALWQTGHPDYQLKE